MKVQYLFSYKNKVGSKLIRWASRWENTGLENIPSHIAILINNQWVAESTLFTGVRWVPYEAWKKNNFETHKIDCTLVYEDKRAAFQRTMDKAAELYEKKYDWKAIAYFGICFLGNILFKKPMPETNPWQDPDKFICTEFVGYLAMEDYSMKTPAALCKDFGGE